MKITAKLADATPVCACRGYVESGDTLQTVDGTCGSLPAWWVACPDCGRALGPARRYPISSALKAL